MPCTDFDNEKPLADIVNLPNKTFLPTLQDHANLMKDFDVLLSHALVKNFSHFQNAFSDVVPKHIPHKHSEKMRLQSKKINLGILFKNENKGEDMIDILRYLHVQGLVPSHGEGDEEKIERISVVGDQLTVERGIEAKFSVSNAYMCIHLVAGLKEYISSWQIGIMRTSFLM